MIEDPYKDIVMLILCSKFAALGSYIDTRINQQKTTKGSTLPENRLITFMLLWALVSIGLGIYAWTAQWRLHWIMPLFGTIIFSIGARSVIVRYDHFYLS